MDGVIYTKKKDITEYMAAFSKYSKIKVFPWCEGWVDYCVIGYNCHYKLDTANHIILSISKFGNFKRLAYWHSLILQFLNSMSFKAIFKGDSFKGDNVLHIPMALIHL